MVVLSSGPNSLHAIKTTSNAPYVGSNHQLIHTKYIDEVVANYDDLSKQVTIVENDSFLDDVDCKMGVSNNTASARRSLYSDKGVMMENEYKQFNNLELSVDINRAKPDDALFIPRRCFNLADFWYHHYNKRELTRREYLDTARYLYEVPDENFRYFASRQLGTEHGVKEMVIVGGIDSHSVEAEIPPLSTDEISYLIALEGNPLVQEGLRELAFGRENYRYDPKMDPHFEYTTGQNTTVCGRRR